MTTLVDLDELSPDDFAHLAAIKRDQQRRSGEERAAARAAKFDVPALGAHRSGSPRELQPGTPSCPPSSGQPWTSAELVAAGWAVDCDRPWSSTAVAVLVDIGGAERIPSPYLSVAITRDGPQPRGITVEIAIRWPLRGG
jgi:hypothetical protein